MFCPNCGNKLSDHSNFCPNCGFNLLNRVGNKSDNVNNINRKSSKHSFMFIAFFIVILLVGIFIYLFVFKGNLNGQNIQAQISKAKSVSDYNVGLTIDDFDTVKFGSYMQNNNKEPIEWIILEKNNGKAILLSKYVLANRPYSFSDSHVNWENSDLREWLNNEFYNTTFSDNEKKEIQNANIKNSRLGLQEHPELDDEKNWERIKDGVYEIDENNGYMLYWHTKGEHFTYTNDKVFIPSYEELDKYFGVVGATGDGDFSNGYYDIQELYCDYLNNKITKETYFVQLRQVLKDNNDGYDRYENDDLFDDYEKLDYLYPSDFSWGASRKALRTKGTKYVKSEKMDKKTNNMPYWIRVESEISNFYVNENTEKYESLPIVNSIGEVYRYYNDFNTRVNDSEIGVRPMIYVNYNGEVNSKKDDLEEIDYSIYNEVLNSLRDSNQLKSHKEITNDSEGNYLGYQLYDYDKDGISELFVYRGYVNNKPYIYDVWTIKNNRMKRLYPLKSYITDDYYEVFYVVNNDSVVGIEQSLGNDTKPYYRYYFINIDGNVDQEKCLSYSDWENSWSLYYNHKKNNDTKIDGYSAMMLINEIENNIGYFNVKILKEKITNSSVLNSNNDNLKNIFGDNVSIDGANITQNPDGSITIGGNENKDVYENKGKFNPVLLEEYNESNCKFDEEGNLWIYESRGLGPGISDGITIKYADGITEEYYEWAGTSSGYNADGGGMGHYDEYIILKNGVKKKDSGYNGEGGGEIGIKVRDIFAKYNNMKNNK